jgi:hypothetical protein
VSVCSTQRQADTSAMTWYSRSCCWDRVALVLYHFGRGGGRNFQRDPVLNPALCQGSRKTSFAMTPSPSFLRMQPAKFHPHSRRAEESIGRSTDTKCLYVNRGQRNAEQRWSAARLRGNAMILRKCYQRKAKCVSVLERQSLVITLWHILGGDAVVGVAREGCARDNVQLAERICSRGGFVTYRDMYGTRPVRARSGG